MQKEKSTNWFTSWFDSPFYYILYKDRDYSEAKIFMKRLTQFLELKKGDTILDLACGQGRHAISLSEMGFDVTGADLSPSSISYAKQFETENLQFVEHDMCLPFGKRFDAVFNLFTSFGYFEKDIQNLQTIKAIKQNLKSTGHGVIDFMNTSWVIKNLVPSEIKTVDEIEFHIERYVQGDHIIKEINFIMNDTPFSFTEKVKVLTLNDFKDYFKAADLTIDYCFGNYELQPFSVDESPRLILIFS